MALRLIHGLSKTNCSSVQERIRIDVGLPEDCSQRAFRQYTWVVWHGRVSVRPRIKPDLVAACGLPIEREATGLQFSGDVPVTESSEPPT